MIILLAIALWSGALSGASVAADEAVEESSVNQLPPFSELLPFDSIEDSSDASLAPPADAIISDEAEIRTFQQQFYAGALILGRTPNENQTLIVDTYSKVGYLNAAQLDVPLAFGGDFAYQSRPASEAMGFDVRFFFTLSPEASVETLLPPDTALLMRRSLYVWVPADVIANSQYWVFSDEFNLRWQMEPNLSLLTGIRYLNMRDRLELLYDFGGDLLFWTNNNLVGGQIGVDLTLWERNRLRIVAVPKFFTGVNLISSGASTNVFFNSDTRDTFNVLSFAMDLNVAAEYQFTRHWSIRTGYQFLWLTSAATAAQQIPNSQFVNEHLSTRTNADSDVIFNGLQVALQANW